MLLSGALSGYAVGGQGDLLHETTGHGSRLAAALACGAGPQPGGPDTLPRDPALIPFRPARFSPARFWPARRPVPRRRPVTAAPAVPGTGIAALAVPDAYLTGAHLAAARAVLDRVVGRDKTLLAYVSGSLAAGLGHGKSDVDLYVAAAGDPPEDCAYRETGVIVQVNPLTPAGLEQIAATCAAYSDTAGSRPQMTQSETALQRAVRWAIGTVLAGGADGGQDGETGGAALPGQEASRTVMRRVLMNRHAYLIGSMAEDTLGALEISDALTALHTSVLCVESAIECALAGTGDLYVGPKFLFRRLARSAALREVADCAWELLRQPAAPALEEAAGLAVRRLLFCSHLVSRAMLDGWDAPAPRIPAFADRRAAGGPVRSPWVHPVRYADTWGMAGPQSGYRTTGAMVMLWHALDGRGLAEVHRELARDTGGGPVPRELLDSAVAQLIGNGAAVTDGGSIRAKGGAHEL